MDNENLHGLINEHIEKLIIDEDLLNIDYKMAVDILNKEEYAKIFIHNGTINIYQIHHKDYVKDVRLNLFDINRYELTHKALKMIEKQILNVINYMSKDLQNPNCNSHIRSLYELHIKSYNEILQLLMDNPKYKPEKNYWQQLKDIIG